MKPRYPDIYVQLSDESGNAASIIARVLIALRRAGVPEVIRMDFATEVRAGDYDHVLQVCQEWVDVG